MTVENIVDFTPRPQIPIIPITVSEAEQIIKEIHQFFNKYDALGIDIQVTLTIKTNTGYKALMRASGSPLESLQFASFLAHQSHYTTDLFAKYLNAHGWQQ